MSIRVLVLTDHKRHSDQNSIYALLLEMLRHPECKSIHIASRGTELNRGFFYGHEPNSLFVAEVTDSFGYSTTDDHFNRGIRKAKVEDFDAVFLRLPRPISDDFLIWIDSIFYHAVIINNPTGIINTSSKKYLLNFPTLTPPMKLCRSVNEVEMLADRMTIVLKPLREYGGKGILKVDKTHVHDGQEYHKRADYLSSIKDTLISEGYLAMKFLKNVTEGDKRILVVRGKVMASSLRMPAKDSWLCNVAQGGTSIKDEITPDEEKMIAEIAPIMDKEGIVIYGVDTLVDDDGTRVISEINTLSVGGFVQSEKQTEKPILKETIKEVFNYINDRT